MRYKLTKEELFIVKDFGKDMLGLPGNDIAPEWLISMVDEIEGWRKIAESVKQLYEDVGDKHV